MTGVDDLLGLLDLAQREDGVWIGSTPSGSERPSLYGGIVAAQALRAAHLSVQEPARPHSIHALFLRAGRFGEPVRIEIDATRDGRSFHARRVEVRQSEGVILTMLASFQRPEEGDDYQIGSARVPVPAGDTPTVATGLETGTGGDGPFAVVDLPPDERRPGSLDWSSVRYWSKARTRLPEDPGLHACALVAMGDLRTGQPPRAARAEERPARMTTLDYSVWLHRPVRADDWSLFDLRAAGNAGARGITYGVVHDTEQRQVASFAMELLLRDLPEARAGS